MSDLKITQQEVARRLGKSRPYIANMLRLLHLPSAIMKMVREESSLVHMRTLLSLKDEALMKKVGKEAVRESWSVRQLEQYVNTYLQEGESNAKSKQANNKNRNLFNNRKGYLKSSMVPKLKFPRLKILEKSRLNLNQKTSLKELFSN